DRLRGRGADPVRISGSNHVTNVDFDLKRGATISGVVIDGDTGLPIPGMDVRAFVFGSTTVGDSDVSWTVSDRDGTYSLQGVPDGVIEVIVWGQGYLEQIKSITVRNGAGVTLDF
ncbi:MAG: carboxypeptidase regulatory-like domain-containing protein, partial [SAR202 cluster bacterium]|nr:carboxypeptidase regulatory-like domain-containing protein [SAR202 cluster bacterium]